MDSAEILKKLQHLIEISSKQEEVQRHQMKKLGEEVAALTYALESVSLSLLAAVKSDDPTGLLLSRSRAALADNQKFASAILQRLSEAA